MPSLPWSEIWLAFSTALLGGALIGAEREWTRHDAGVRTNALVAFGACLFSLLSRTVFAAGDGDPGRVAAQVVTGIGFIGAGVIMQRRARVVGLTTAAALWVSAAVGLTAGAGEYALALVAAAVVLGVQTILRFLENRLMALRERERGPLHEYELTLLAPAGRDRMLYRILHEYTGVGAMRLRQATVAPEAGGRQQVMMTLVTREAGLLKELQAQLAVSGYIVQSLDQRGASTEPLPKRRWRYPR